MTTADSWQEVGRRLGAPGVDRMRDAGPGRALLAAAIVAIFYAQGGVFRAVAGGVLIALLLRPGPQGVSMLEAVTKGVSHLLEGKEAK